MEMGLTEVMDLEGGHQGVLIVRRDWDTDTHRGKTMRRHRPSTSPGERPGTLLPSQGLRRKNAALILESRPLEA